MKWINNVSAWLELAKLFQDPPSLFHHLHGLAWYRGALMATLPRTQAGLDGQVVLEIGCATGDFSGAMVTLGATVHGIDRSNEMVRRAMLRHAAAQFEVADAHALPFGEDKFDIVFAASLLNVVSDPAQVLREMVRVCRPNGVLALLVPAAEFRTAEARRWVSEQRMVARDAAAYMTWHRLAKKVSADQLTQWLDDAGLAHARSDSQCLLGGMVRVIHVYPKDR